MQIAMNVTRRRRKLSGNVPASMRLTPSFVSSLSRSFPVCPAIAAGAAPCAGRRGSGNSVRACPPSLAQSAVMGGKTLGIRRFQRLEGAG